MRDKGTIAMCVSGSSAADEKVSGPDNSMSVPVSATAQKHPVIHEIFIDGLAELYRQPC